MEAFIDPDGLLRQGSRARLVDTCWWGLRKCRTTVPFVGLTAGQPGEQVKWPEISLSPSCNPRLYLPFPNQAQVHPGSESQGELDRKAVERLPPASERSGISPRRWDPLDTQGFREQVRGFPRVPAQAWPPRSKQQTLAPLGSPAARILKPELPALSPLLGRMSGPLTPSVPLHTSTGHHRLRLCSLGASLAAATDTALERGSRGPDGRRGGHKVPPRALRSPRPVPGESLLFSAGEVHLQTARLEGVRVVQEGKPQPGKVRSHCD